jgi:hypothetical protein
MAGNRRRPILAQRRAHREQGSGEDAYEVFEELHRAGWLLPDDDDRLRDVLERNAHIIDAAADSIPAALAEALDQPDRDVAVSLSGLIEARIHATAPGEEVWIANRDSGDRRAFRR